MIFIQTFLIFRELIDKIKIKDNAVNLSIHLGT